MFNPEELTLLLERGRILQEEIGTFITRPTLTSSRRLVTRIDRLIGDIKPQLLNPSFTEDNQMSLVITRLGSIVKNLKDIKHTIKTA
ncbi:hypothetical protein RVIR1_04610 [Candidatus Rickettsiella viridis]|uniref:Uncharacterized protein n=1 Tax=Candidatus Rickettsiella viridis TaxID=676208 RepID=A0A2Z5UVI5_9COXI|nr:hypothetical protein RVIR1_04610 [Candidatus Rickettsiella viridis]